MGVTIRDLGNTVSGRGGLIKNVVCVAGSTELRIALGCKSLIRGTVFSCDDARVIQGVEHMASDASIALNRSMIGLEI